MAAVAVAVVAAAAKTTSLDCCCCCYSASSSSSPPREPQMLLPRLPHHHHHHHHPRLQKWQPQQQPTAVFVVAWLSWCVHSFMRRPNKRKRRGGEWWGFSCVVFSSVNDCFSLVHKTMLPPPPTATKKNTHKLLVGLKRLNRWIDQSIAIEWIR